jgi:ubiquinone/menaquinone biosynthesis C-methylase UbiE
MEQYVTILPSTYDELALDFEWYERIRLELIKAMLQERPRIVDVGTRDGETLIQVADSISAGVGIDIDGQALGVATHRIRDLGGELLHFVCGDALDLPLPGGNYDIVLILGDVLSYPNLFGKTQQVFREASRVLRPNGIVAVDGTNWPWEYAQSPEYQAFVREADDDYAFCSITRTPEGYETVQNWPVLQATPLHDWLLDQSWPVCRQGYQASLQVRLDAPLPQVWLGHATSERYQYFTPQTITRELQANGFEKAAAICYGLTYDVTSRAGLTEAMRQHVPVLARAEAELALMTHSGAGPWLFAWASTPAQVS